jgi:hypothetical protein
MTPDNDAPSLDPASCRTAIHRFRTFHGSVLTEGLQIQFPPTYLDLQEIGVALIIPLY